MSHDRQVYLLNPKELTPETIAVTFAKTSRSPESFRQIAAELTEAKSAQFHEKWVVGYGHASVAEHAVLHIAIENVSRLAIEAIESSRLASYTEKSTRYQKWDPEAFFIPPDLKEGSALRREFAETCRRLFGAYEEALVAVKAAVQRESPPKEGESQAAYERRIRSEYIDVCRFLLPAASLANVGVTANARVLEHAIQKMLSDPLPEVREIGASLHAVARQEVPTLLRYADPSDYLIKTRSALEQPDFSLAGEAGSNTDWCRLVTWDAQGERHVLAAALFRYGGMDYPAALAQVERMEAGERAALAARLLGELGRFDLPLRELEHSRFTFELTVDQGAYFEIKRHRMMTQTPQALTARLGYALPRRMVAAGFAERYCEAMEAARETYERLAGENPHLAAYIVPNGYNRRVLLTFNLREAFHFCALRSTEKAHFSVRRAALRIAEEIQRQMPALGSYLRLPSGETWQTIEAANFEKTQ